MDLLDSSYLGMKLILWHFNVHVTLQRKHEDKKGDLALQITESIQRKWEISIISLQKPTKTFTF